MQKDIHSRPRIPSLTPIGFAQFLTTCILAYPDEEFRRLEKIVADIPLLTDIVRSADGRPKTLPRTMVRSCLPTNYDPKKRKLLEGAIDDLLYDLRLSAPSPCGSQTTVTGYRTGSSTIATHLKTGHLRYDPRGLQLTCDQDNRGSRKRFVPGALDTIGDVDITEIPRGSPSRDPGHENNNQQARPTSIDLQGDTELRPTSIQYGPRLMGRNGRAGQQISAQRSHSYSHSTTLPLSSSIPPPPIGPRSSAPSNIPIHNLLRRPHSPQLHGHSVSEPDIHMVVGSPSSSATVFTPSSFSSTSASPTIDHGALAHFPQRRADQQQHQTFDEHVVPQQLSSAVVLRGQRGQHNPSGQGVRYRRNVPSVESIPGEDEHGMTWGEYLKGQHKSDALAQSGKPRTDRT